MMLFFCFFKGSVKGKFVKELGWRIIWKPSYVTNSKELIYIYLEKKELVCEVWLVLYFALSSDSLKGCFVEMLLGSFSVTQRAQPEWQMKALVRQIGLNLRKDFFFFIWQLVAWITLDGSGMNYRVG